jgi:hypothetical protein
MGIIENDVCMVGSIASPVSVVQDYVRMVFAIASAVRSIERNRRSVCHHVGMVFTITGAVRVIQDDVSVIGTVASSVSVVEHNVSVVSPVRCAVRIIENHVSVIGTVRADVSSVSRDRSVSRYDGSEVSLSRNAAHPKPNTIGSEWSPDNRAASKQPDGPDVIGTRPLLAGVLLIGNLPNVQGNRDKRRKGGGIRNRPCPHPVDTVRNLQISVIVLTHGGELQINSFEALTMSSPDAFTIRFSGIGCRLM